MEEAVLIKKEENKFPTEIIDLPSRGLLYPPDSPLASGQIEIKYMTAKEEDILTTESYINKNIVVDKLLESVIVTKVNYGDLLAGDKNAIMIKTRAFGYGPEYKTELVKGNGDKIPITINLLDIGYKMFDESKITKGVNEFSFVTPKGKNTVVFKLLTVGEQNKIAQDLLGMRKIGPDRRSEGLSYRLKQMIISIDGNQDRTFITNFVDNMLASDSRAFREYIRNVQPDIELNVETEDPNSGESFRGDIQINADFFYPDYKR